jgi:hypothetical protein
MGVARSSAPRRRDGRPAAVVSVPKLLIARHTSLAVGRECLPVPSAQALAEAAQSIALRMNAIQTRQFSC